MPSPSERVIALTLQQTSTACTCVQGQRRVLPTICKLSLSIPCSFLQLSQVDFSG